MGSTETGKQLSQWELDDYEELKSLRYKYRNIIDKKWMVPEELTAEEYLEFRELLQTRWEEICSLKREVAQLNEILESTENRHRDLVEGFRKDIKILQEELILMKSDK